MRISDWSSDVCSSDLCIGRNDREIAEDQRRQRISVELPHVWSLPRTSACSADGAVHASDPSGRLRTNIPNFNYFRIYLAKSGLSCDFWPPKRPARAEPRTTAGLGGETMKSRTCYRSEEHTSELQSL